ncbi:MAG: hypothetical protein M1820_010431 [Bogoriella megaspora]|nr:MAG: hypothetical protein M1820_010431 [Bogoriella megaspora]
MPCDVKSSSQSRKSLAGSPQLQATSSQQVAILSGFPYQTPNMLSRTSRSLRAFQAKTLRAIVLRASYTTPTDNPIPANPSPNQPEKPTHVSATSELPTSSEGSHDRALQESVEQGTEMKEMQAPNRSATWSRSQQPREKAMVGPRFEQIIMADQDGLNWKPSIVVER